MNRRQFMAVTGTSWLLGSRFAVSQEVEKIIAGKDSALKIVSTDPLVLETPDPLLAAQRITPIKSLFVRNHHGAKTFSTMKTRPLEGNLEVTGLVRYQKAIPLTKLAKLEQNEVEMVLQCSGNFRFLFSKLSPIKGTPWVKGGVGNVKFKGVPISILFKELKLEIDPSAKYLTIEGADQPEKEGQADYEKSVPLEVAIERGILALELNGEPLPAVHGGPVRFVIPGYYGCSHVKWATRLRLEASETANAFQLPDYRTPKKLIKPGEQIEYTFQNSVPNFDMRINARMLSPSEKGIVRANEPILCKGITWNDGAAKIDSVDVSIDRGKTWTAAELEKETSPYAFREWSLKITFPKGEHQVWIKATDALGRSQPLDGGIFWNPGGYTWNGIDQVNITAT